jgi:hypothetical protein
MSSAVSYLKNALSSSALLIAERLFLQQSANVASIENPFAPAPPASAHLLVKVTLSVASSSVL